MENRDLKDVFKTVKEKKRKEKIERLIIYLSGILLTLVFVAIGLNFFSGKADKEISQPDVKIVKDINQPVSSPVIPRDTPVGNVDTGGTDTRPKTVQESQKVESNTAQGIKDESQTKLAPEKSQPPSEPVSKNQGLIKEKEAKVNTDESQIKNQSKKEIQKKQEQKTVVSKEIVKDGQIKEKEDKKDILSMLTSGYYSIQTGAFSTKEKALEEKSKYKNAFILEENGLYKVLVGKFATDKEAKEFKSSNNIDGFVKRIKD